MKLGYIILIVVAHLVSYNLMAQQRQFVLPSPNKTVQFGGINTSDTTQRDHFELIDLTSDSLVLGYLRDKGNASFWRMTVGEKLSGKYRNIFDNVHDLVLKNYHGRGVSGEAVKINADTGEAEW